MISQASMTTALFCLVLAAPAAAQTETITLTREEVLARAVSTSDRIREAAARHDATNAVTDQRQAAQRPQVTAQVGYTRTNHITPFGIPVSEGQFRVVYPDVPDNYRSRLDVAWPIYSGGRLQAFERAAQQEANATGRDVEALTTDIRFEAERAFWTLIVADESLRVLGESLARTTVHVTNVRNALSAGLVPPNEVLTAEAQEARQRMFRIQAQSARAVAEADLARQIGAPPGTAITAVVPADVDQVEDAASALMARAVAQRKDRQALVDRQSAAATRVVAAAAARRPMVAIGGGVDYANPNPRFFPRDPSWRRSWDASVNVNWALFDGGRSRAEGAEALALQRALEARLREFDSVTALDIRQRLAEIESSRAALQAADASVRAATEALRVVNDRYAAGVAISTDVLDADFALLQAELDRTRAQAGVRLADARLARALGR